MPPSTIPRAMPARPPRRVPLSTFALATALAAALLPAIALAQPATPSLSGTSAIQHYSIPAGPLGERLNQFARQAGVNLSFTPEQVRGRQSPGLTGSYSARTALERLLAGSGLVMRADGTGYTLAPAPRADEVFQFSDIRVQGSSPTEEFKDMPYQTAGSVNVITRDDIERFRGTSVGDIFQGTPGVLIGENRNSGGLDVNIRGMQGQGRVPVLVDGARQETTVYRGYAGVSSRSYIDPDLIGGITIDKGPTMADGGAGATGGLVSMRTINADDIVKAGETFGIRIRGQAIGNNSGSAPAPGTPAGYHLGNIGDDGVYRIDCARPDICSQQHPNQPRSYAMPRRFAPDEGMDRPAWYRPKSWAGSIAIAQRFESMDLVAAVAKRNQGNYYAGKHGPTPYMDFSDQRKLPFYTEVRPRREGATRFRGEERIVNSNYESESALLKTRLYLPNDQELELSYLRYKSAYGELMPSQLMWFGSVRQTDNSHVTANTYTARYEWNPADNDWVDLRASLWHTRTSTRNVFYYFVIGDQSYTEGSSDVAERYKRTGLDISNTTRFQVWGDPELRYGVSLQREDVVPLEVEGSGGMSTMRDGKRSEYSLFANLKWEILPTLTLDAGIRHTRYKAEDRKPIDLSGDSIHCRDEDGDGKCDPVYHNAKNSGTAPVVSLTWEPTDGVQLYARYAEAYRMPSLFENTQGFSVSPSLDVDIRPEHAKNREIGLNLLHSDVLLQGDKLRTKLAYFQNNTKDYLTRTSVNLWEENQGTTADFFRLRNIDSARFHGMELTLQYDAGTFFAELGATKYNKIEVCHHGSLRRFDCTDYGVANSYVNNMIPPRWHASAKLGVRLFQRRLLLGVRGTFMGQRNMGTFHDDTRNGFNQPVPWHSYRVYDLFASYRVNDSISVDLNVDNFTDRYYLDALSLGLVPAPGRTARLSVTLQF